MKKIAYLLLISIYFISVTDTKEIFKLNLLFHHFEETKKQDASISFLNYLVMHYITDDGNDQDDETDSKLPFKAIQVYSIIGFVSAPIQFGSGTVSAFGWVKNDYLVEDDFLIVTSYNTLVWHPPQYS